MTNILGINVWSHDSSACIFMGDQLICALEEERLNGEKHSKKFPELAIERVLCAAGINFSHIDCISVGWDIKRKIRNMFLKPAINNDLEFLALPQYFDLLKGYFNTESFIREKYKYDGRIEFVEHHLSHSRYSQYSCNVLNAVSVVVDGFGDCETLSVFDVEGRNHKKVFGIDFPNSLGLFYSSVTDFLGFIPNCDEGIVMGLSAYGNPSAVIPGVNITYIEFFRQLVSDDNDSIFRVDNKFFPWGNYRQGYYSPLFVDILGNARVPKGEISDHHKNIAAALQLRCEEVLIRIVKHAVRVSGKKDVLLSGGVALNCVANAKLSNFFEKDSIHIHVPQNPGDAGVAVGAAINSLNSINITPKSRPLVSLGPIYPAQEIDSAVESSPLKVTKPISLVSQLATSIACGKICSIYQLGSEFGPRALGFRSILASPFPASMKDTLNLRVKFREYFRPFAPIVREEDVSKYFDINYFSPYMMHAVRVHPQKVTDIPAIVHIDGTARVQTVNQKDSPFIYDLLTMLGQLTNTPIVLNTSFNVKGQPIVETPQQAVDTILSTNIDCLAMPPYFLEKMN